MSFSKFKLDAAPSRSTPVPIIPACRHLPPAPASQPGHSAAQSSSHIHIPLQNLYTQQSLGDEGADLHDPHSITNLRYGTVNRNAAAASTAVNSKSYSRRRRTVMARKSAFCLACKASKTRCETDVTRPGVSCSRCQRLSKQCVLEAELPSIASATTFSTESTVGPILDLPHDSSALRVPLEAQQGWETPRESRSERDRKRQAEAASSFSALTNQSSKLFLSALERLRRPVTNLPALRPLPSVEDRWLHGRISSLISREAAQQAFYHYVDSFTPKFPVVIFPSGTNVHDLMEKKPIVFLSILSVASAGYCSVEAHKALVLESKRTLAGRAIVQGEKSLELVQALQIASLWYRSPGDFKQVNFDQLASIMLTMAVELELECDDVSRSVQNEEVWEHAEIQRACLSCFIISER